jgi:cell division protein FtsA
MKKEEIIAGLDLGSTAVRLVVGQKSHSEGKLHIIGASEIPARGVNKGVVTSIEEASASIFACVEKTEKMIGMSIDRAWVGISGSHVVCQESKGVVAVSKIDGEIREEDVERAIEAARTVTTPPNYEILHVIPKNFTVDNQTGIKDPVGMTGVRLEVDAQLILGLSSQIKNLTKSIYQAGLDIEDLVLSILATAESVVTDRQKELGTVVVNIGGATTSLVVFEEGDVLHAAVLPIGSEHVTADVAIGLRISIDAAERIKITYGNALPKEINKKDEIDLKEFSDIETGMVSKKYIAEIIEARIEEIFDKVDQELKKINRSGLLPAGAILTGGGAKLLGIVEVAKRRLRLPAALGFPLNLSSVVDKVNNLSFATATGLVLWGEQVRRESRNGRALSKFSGGRDTIRKVRHWFRSLIP